jgi:hypothetical protein
MRKRRGLKVLIVVGIVGYLTTSICMRDIMMTRRTYNVT